MDKPLTERGARGDRSPSSTGTWTSGSRSSSGSSRIDGTWTSPKLDTGEETALAEVTTLIRRYLSEEEDEHDMHEVLIVPQSDSQFDAVRSLLPGTEVKRVRGGDVFTAGRFYSPRYAEAVCEKYIDLGRFSVRIEV